MLSQIKIKPTCDVLGNSFTRDFTKFLLSWSKSHLSLGNRLGAGSLTESL